MLLTFMPIKTGNGEKIELCLAPEKVDLLTLPLKISDLQPQSAAVFRVGSDEAVYITVDSKDGGTIVTPISPGSIYLTPNLPSSPGFKTKRVKIVTEDDRIRTYYDRDKGVWDEWIANKERL